MGKAGLLVFVALLSYGSAARASGFQLREQSGEGLGNAYAGSTAKAYDVDTVFYNPAGMTRLQGNQAGASAAWIAPSSQFQGSAVLGGAEIGGSDGRDHLREVTVGAAYAMWDVAPDWRVGLAISSPFGMRSDYKEDWVGRYLALDATIIDVNVSPSVAYRVNEALSLSVGLQLDWVDTSLSNAINFGALVPGSGDGLFKVSGDDVGVGGTASALYEFSPQTRMGLSYRSTIRHAIHGKAKFHGVPAALGGNVAFADSAIDTVVTLPDVVALGLYHDLSPQWAVMSDVSWTRWSVFRRLRLGFESGRDDVVQTQNWQDTWFFSLGATFTPKPGLSLHMGAAYDMSPVSDAYRNARIPDSDRFWLSGGLSYELSPGHKLSLSYAHIFAGSANIQQSDPDGIGGTLSGRYRNHVDVLSAGYTLRF